MNINNYTIKSQEAIQQAHVLAQGFEHQQIENEHILKAIFEVDENVTPFILKKLNVNVELIKQIIDKQLESYSKVSGGDIMLSREAGKTINEASVQVLLIQLSHWALTFLRVCRSSAGSSTFRDTA